METRPWIKQRGVSQWRQTTLGSGDQYHNTYWRSGEATYRTTSTLKTRTLLLVHFPSNSRAPTMRMNLYYYLRYKRNSRILLNKQYIFWVLMKNLGQDDDIHTQIMPINMIANDNNNPITNDNNKPHLQMLVIEMQIIIIIMMMMMMYNHNYTDVKICGQI